MLGPEVEWYPAGETTGAVAEGEQLRPLRRLEREQHPRLARVVADHVAELVEDTGGSVAGVDAEPHLLRLLGDLEGRHVDRDQLRLTLLVVDARLDDEHA